MLQKLTLKTDRLMPIASIITPATLSVVLALMDPPPSLLVDVPNLDFRSLSFVAAMLVDQNAEIFDAYSYNGPSQAVLEIASAVAAQGAILPITPPSANASWSLTFYGPSLKCANISDTRRQQWSNNIGSYLTGGVDGVNCGEPYGYLAWFPRSLSTTNSSVDDLPFVNISGTFTPDSGSISDYGNNQNMTLYLMTMPDQLQVLDDPTHTTPISCYLLDIPGDELWPQWNTDSTEIQCQLFNSTYNVDFNYINGAQDISVSTSYSEADNAITTANNVTGPFAGDYVEFNHCLTLSISGTECEFDQKVLTTLSFQAIMDAFSQNLMGTISLKGGTNESLTLNVNSSIMATSLMNTTDLEFLENYIIIQDEGTAYPDLQTELTNLNYSETQGLLNNYQEVKNQTLALAIEELFRNTVVSMMSSPALQPNLSSISAPPPTNVTFQTTQNIYVYAVWKLWLAYGIAIGLAVVAAVVALLAMYENEATYSNSFSTIFRLAKGAEVDVKIQEDDLDGKDPLPEYIANARISLMEGMRRRRLDDSSLGGHSVTISDMKESEQQTNLLENEAVDR